MRSYFQQELLLRQNSFWRIHPRRSYIHATLYVEWVNVTTISNQVLLRVSSSLGACVDSAASGYGFSSYPPCRSPWPGFHLSNRVDERTTILAGIGKIQPLPSIRSRKFFFFFDRSFAIFFRPYLSFFILSPRFSSLRFSWPCSRPSQPLHREMACREISRRWWRSRERVQSLPLFSACVHSSMFVDPPLFNVLSLIVTFDLYPPRGSHPSSLGRSSSIGGGGGSGQQRVQRLAAGPGSVSLVTAPHKGIAL